MTIPQVKSFVMLSIMALNLASRIAAMAKGFVETQENMKGADKEKYIEKIRAAQKKLPRWED